jgi:membrane dipeptidase
MADVLRVSAAPPVFSHSSCRALCAYPRNVPDDILARLAGAGGVVMVTFVPQFVSQDYADWHAACREGVSRGGGDPDNRADWSAAVAEFTRTHPRPRVSLAQVADHVDHVRELAGVGQIGVGGDYDGTEHQPEGLEDVSIYPALFAELARRGYSDEDLAGIAGGNVLRLLRTAEGVATRLRAEREPSRTRIDDLDGDREQFTEQPE